MVLSFQNNISNPERPDLSSAYNIVSHQSVNIFSDYSPKRRRKTKYTNERNPYHTRLRVVNNNKTVTNNVGNIKNTAPEILHHDSSNAEVFAMWESLAEIQHVLQQKTIQNKTKIQESYEFSVQAQSWTKNGNDSSFIMKFHNLLIPRIYESDLDVNSICGIMKMSKTNLFRKLKSATGLSISLYIRKLKLIKGKELLKTTDLNIAEIAYQSGFNDPKYFSRAFNEVFGLSPKELRTRM